MIAYIFALLFYENHVLIHFCFFRRNNVKSRGGERKAVEPTNHGDGMEVTDYEAERNEHIRIKMQKLEELNILPIAQQLKATPQANRKKKVCIPMNLKCSQINVLKEFYESIY